MCHRSCHKDNKSNNTQYVQLKRNLGILVLFTFLGLPWLLIVAVSVVAEVGVYVIQPAVLIITRTSSVCDQSSQTERSTTVLETNWQIKRCKLSGGISRCGSTQSTMRAYHKIVMNNIHCLKTGQTIA